MTLSPEVLLAPLNRPYGVASDSGIGAAAASPCHRSDLAVHELDGEAVLYDAVRADTHRLNETAFFIWQRCDGRHDAVGIAREMAKLYDVSFETALVHVVRLIGELQSRQLMRVDGRVVQPT